MLFRSLGGSLSLSDTTDAQTLLREASAVQGLTELATMRSGLGGDASAPAVAAAIDFLLEGLYSQKKISRTEDRGYHGAEPVRRSQPPSRSTMLTEDDDENLLDDLSRRKKKYYN